MMMVMMMNFLSRSGVLWCILVQCCRVRMSATEGPKTRFVSARIVC